MSKIEVEKLGAVRRATIPVPEDGGVVVLRGQNGSGKSSTLAAVDKMMRRSTDGPTVTDGHDRGTIAGLGVQMSVQRSTRYSGELEVVALDSKLSVADLVDPEIADPRAADAKRMKAILAILKVEPTLDEWIAESDDLAYQERVKREFAEAPDLLTFALRVKRFHEENARAIEKDIDGHQKAIDVLAKDPRVMSYEEPAPPPSDDDLAAALAKATEREKEISDRAIRSEAAAGLESSIGELESSLCDEVEIDEKVDAINAELDQIAARLAELHRNRNALVAQADKSRQCRTEIAKLKKKLESSAPPTPEEIEAASLALASARDAFRVANETRRLIEARRQVSTHAAVIASAKQSAIQSRELAKSVDAKLGAMVGQRVPGLSFDDGRMIYQHKKRGAVQFADLSHGERSLVACQILINGLGAGGLATLPQEFWEGLDPKNRKAIAKLATDTGVVLITAECSADPELTAEVFSG